MHEWVDIDIRVKNIQGESIAEVRRRAENTDSDDNSICSDVWSNNVFFHLLRRDWNAHNGVVFKV